MRKRDAILEAINQGTTDVICVKDREGKILMANPAMCRLLGKSESELLGKDDLVFVLDEQQAKRIRENDRRIMQTRCAEIVEETLDLQNGRRVYLFAKSPYLDARGDVLGVVGIGVDVTESKRTQEALRQSQANYLEVFNATHEAIFVHEAGTGRIIDVNDTMLRMYGYDSKAEAIAQHIADLGTNEAPYTQEIAQRRVGQAIEEGPQVFEWLGRKKNGERIWVEVSLRSARIGGEGCVLAVVRDIRERKQAEQMLAETTGRYRSLFENMLNGFAYCRMVYERGQPKDFVYLDVNLAFTRLTGLHDVVGRRVSAVIPGIYDTNPELFEVYGRVALTGVPERIETFVPGLGIWFSISVYCPEKEHFAAVFENITDHKRAELRIAAFASLGQRLNEVKTARKAAKIIVEVADELLGWDCCLFQLYSAEANRLSCLLCMDVINGRRTECEPPDFPRSPTELAKRAIEEGGQLIVRGQAESTQAETVPFGGSSPRSACIMFVPIRHGTEIVGVLSIESYTPKAYDAFSLETLQALADHAGGALERLRAQDALGESEAIFRSVWERSLDGMRLTDNEGRIIAVNDAFCQLVKLPREKLEGQVYSVAYRGHGPDDAIKVYQKRFATGDVVPRLSARAQLWNGEEPHLDISTSFVELGQRGKMLLSIFRDVTERRRAELQLEAFSHLGQRLSTARSPAEAARAIYASADQFWRWDSGVLDLLLPESQQVETALAYDLVDGRRREVLTPTPIGPPSPMIRRVLSQGAELILRRPDEPPATDTSRFGDASRLSASVMIVPVRVENRAVGVLSIQSYSPNAYTQQDLRTLQALADHCSGALDRLRMEELLRGSEVRYRRLFETAKDGVLILDAETGVVVDVNPFLVQLLGFSREALLGKKLWELASFQSIVANYDHFKKLQAEGYLRYDDKPLKTADGRRIDVEFVSNVYQVNHQAVFQCNIRDITARKHTAWLGQIYQDQLRALSARIETMREEERTRLSREIHDELGQMLTGIKMDLRWIERSLDEFGEDRRVNPILDKLVSTAELADATVKAVQRIAAELRPGILDELGLPTALQYEAGRFEERTGIACRLTVPGDASALPPQIVTAFYRIFQEALTNVSRHAEAKAVEVQFRQEPDGCCLEIRDNGRGMAGVDLRNLKSLGLLGMEERAALLGGGVSFAPRAGGGTVVTVRIPNNPTRKGCA